MRKISRIEPVHSGDMKRQRVAAYARVSKDTERLKHSISAQISCYSKRIQNNPEWEYAGVYADWGITGTDIKKRQEFQRLLSDCEAGKIDIVLTKSISRFARNTVDLLETVRHLKALGIEVRFEKEHINSLSGDGELMLSILASFAQEESRSISENIKWGIRKKYERGAAGISNRQVFGYQYDGEKYVMVPEEADIVRLIFRKYAAGVTVADIIRQLEDIGAKSRSGCSFSYSHINYIVRNEIYCGDRLLQKSFVEDPVRHNKVRNQGQLPRYYIMDCHEAIVDRETFEKAREETRRRAARRNPAYCFTGKIRCGICGRPYTRRSRHGKYVYWFCRAKKEGESCKSPNLREEELERISARMMGLVVFDEESFREKIRGITVLPEGGMEFHFFEGRTQRWENI